jgi:hypothetical protein
MTYLEELWRARPLAERYPPHAWPIDSEPWNGREADRFAWIYDRARIVAASVRSLRDTEPEHEDVKIGHMMLVHFTVRRDAMLKSWCAQGLAN